MGTKSAWLGKDLQSWSQSIRNGYIRAFILFALHYTGVFQALRSGDAKTTEELASECAIDAHLLDGVLNFLVYADVVLGKENNRFFLTARGKEWLFTDRVIAMSWGAVGAYSCLLYELVPTLQGDKRYGRDFIRRGDLIAVGSHATGKANYPWVVSELSRLGVKKVVDLGCGSADVLIDFCNIDPHLQGVGIDISPEALEEAQRRVSEAGLENRISLCQGDIIHPRSFKRYMDNVDAFNGIMVFHEFLCEGGNILVDILHQMKELFPGRYLIIGEFNKVSDKEFEAMPYPDRIHPLFYQYIIHPLTWQVLLPKESWLSLFERAGLEIIKVEDDFPFRLTEYVLRL